MRRKSTRNTQKTSSEKVVKEAETPPRTRRSRRRKRSPSKSSDSEEEVVKPVNKPEIEEAPDTTTKSHSNSDEEPEEPTWKVTSSEDAHKGEIHKLKICLKRPSAPDSPDKNKLHRSKSNSHTEDDTSSEDKSTARRTRSHGSFVSNDGLTSQEADEDVEEKKGKGKSKNKHKSKVEKSPHLNEPETQSNNEISENVQVTPQSPSIDKPVDNESDYKVGVDDLQNVNQNRGNVIEESASSSKNLKKDSNKKDYKSKSDSNNDNERLSVIKKKIEEEKTHGEGIEESDNFNKGCNDTTKEGEDLVKEAEVITEDHKSSTEKSENLPKEEIQQVPEEADPASSEPPAIENIPEPDHEMVEERCPKELQLEKEQMSNVDEEVQEKDTEVEPSTTLDNNSEHDTEEDNSKNVKITPDTSSSQEIVQAEVPLNTESTEESVPQSITKEHLNNDAEKRPRKRLKRDNEPLKSQPKEAVDESSESNSQMQLSKTKRKWETSSLTSTLVKINLDVIQTVCPNIEFPEEPDLKVDSQKERRRSDSSIKKLDRKVSIEYKSDSERVSFEKQISIESSTQDNEDNSNIIAFNRKISIVDDTASKLKPPPSPAKNPVSDILYITNLVRPFTIKQLKELLERTGKIKEEGFWTDRIKSKCYVQYESQEEAEATRNALHGVQWPIGNGKNLVIDYAVLDDMDKAKNPPTPPPPVTQETKGTTNEKLEPEPKKKPEEVKQVEKKKSDAHVREWDIGKKDLQRNRSRSRERSRKHRRSPSPSDDFISRKQKKTEENIPQKLMDDLFLKTKATPSIYWQPLSPEEISMKEQQRLVRMEEYKRRMEEKMKIRERDSRGPFRRRYS